MPVPVFGEVGNPRVVRDSEINDYVGSDGAPGWDGDAVVEEVHRAVHEADAHYVVPETAGCHCEGFGGVFRGGRGGG